MLKRSVSFFLVGLCICLTVIGCATTSPPPPAPAPPPPEHPDKVAIRAMISQMDDAWRKNQKDRYLSYFHRDARIMNGPARRVMVLPEYAAQLPRLMHQFPRMMRPVDIILQGDRAVVRVILTARGNQFPETWHLVKVGRLWKFMWNEY